MKNHSELDWILQTDQGEKTTDELDWILQTDQGENHNELDLIL